MSGPDPRFSTASIISPHSALEALAAQSGIDPRDSMFSGQPGTSTTVPTAPHPAHDRPRASVDPAKGRPASRTSYLSGTSTSTSPSHLTTGRPTSMTPSPGRATPRRSAYGPSQALPTPPAEPQRVFVRAKYDFEATDESALSFSAGEVIEVYTKLDSGWWDGLLGTTRGWFPSNFVEAYDVREMEHDFAVQAGHHGDLAQSVVQDQDQPQDPEEGHGEYDEGQEAADGARHGSARDSGTSDGLDWAEAMTKGGGGWDAGSGAGGLDELAREVLQGAGIDDYANAGADDFGAAAADRRRRQAQHDETLLATLGRMGNADLADEMGPDEFGVGPRRRQREDTVRTITLQRGPLGGQDKVNPGTEGHSHSRQPSTAESEAGKGADGAEKLEESAWVPTLTDDGQVYYHNAVTGEDSWHLPEPALARDDKGAYDYDDDDNNFFQSLTASSSGAFGVPSSRSIQTPDQSEETFAPPAHKRDLPANWVARLSDDGREWFYVNRLTGQTQRELPVGELTEKINRLSVGSSKVHSMRGARAPRPRRSLELRRKAVEDWSKDTRAALEGVMVPPKAKNMSWHMETTQDALQKVLEAASLGISSEEDLARARDLDSQNGIESALAQQDDAVLMLKAAFKGFIAAVQTLYKAYGYVGPGEGIVDMPRPQWSTDLSIVGLVGRLGAVIHAATESKYLPKEANSVWSEVIKVGGRLRDVLGSFPEKVSPGQPRTIQDGKIGNRHELVLHTAGVGRILAGRWGFGDLPADEGAKLRVLDHSVVTDLRRLRDEYEAVEYRDDTVLQLVRLSTRFKAALLKVDVAEVVDVDGDMSDRTPEDEARAYEELLVRVTNAVLDLEEYSAQIDELAMDLLQKAELAPDVYGALRVSLDGSFTAVESLLQLGTQQKALAASSTTILAQIGHRSPRFVRRASAPPVSMVSTISRASRGSRPSVTRGLDEELLDGEMEAEQRDRAGEMVSASRSASQTSLLQHQQPQQQTHAGRRHGSQGDVSGLSAASSTASLGYQQAESDGGSVRGKRTSLMNFMRGRSSTDDDGRGTFKSKGPSKKLAKLLGEDYAASQAGPSAFGTVPPPPPVPAFLSPPETPWYLGDDYPAADIVIDDKGQVRGGTLPALVARLTPHGSTDTAFFQAFLLTFRSFTTGSELVELLFDRYMLEAPDSLDERQYAEWKKMKQTPIRLRVSNVLRSWLDVHYLEAEDAVVLDPIENFASTTMASEGSELLSRQLVALVQRRRMGERVGERKGQQRIISASASDNVSWPPLIVPRHNNGRVAKLTDIAPLEMARQLTIIEFQHFQNITMNECLNKRWSGPECDRLAPNIRAIIRMANVVAGWVTTCIIAQRDTKARAGVIKYFIQTSQELRNLNNFSSMASVMAGVNSAPVLRLKRTNDLIAPKYWTMKNGLDKTLDSTKNFSNYKDMLKTINPPCVPFFGFWLSALTFIEDGNKNFLKPPGSEPAPTGASPAPGAVQQNPTQAQTPLTASTSTSTSVSAATASTTSPAILPARPVPQPSGPLINFFKHSLAAEILRDIQQYQSQPYNLARSAIVYEYITTQFERFKKDLPNMDRLYEQSLELEPREREEERITRMLHDSGFI